MSDVNNDCLADTNKCSTKQQEEDSMEFLKKIEIINDSKSENKSQNFKYIYLNIKKIFKSKNI